MNPSKTRSFFKCQLCWALSFATFIGILLVQIILTVPLHIALGHKWTWQTLSLITASSVIITTVTMWVLHIFVIKPLLLLLENLKQVAIDPKNYTSHQIKTQRDDEVGETIKAFNHILHKLSLYVDQLKIGKQALRETKKLLEHRVKERSIQLSLANEKLDRKKNECSYYQQKLFLLSNKDYVTDLPNRAVFEDHLEQYAHLAHTNKTKLAVFYINIITPGFFIRKRALKAYQSKYLILGRIHSLYP